MGNKVLATTNTSPIQARAPLLTRNEIVRLEGSAAAAGKLERADNPYRPGSADWRAWSLGFEG